MAEPAPLLRFEARAMASPLRLAVHGLDPIAAEAAWAEVRDEFERCEEAMSRFRETSELTALNRASASGRGIHVSARLRRALVAADRAARVTGGRFDARRLRDLDRLGYRGVPVVEERSRETGGVGPPDIGARLADTGARLADTGVWPADTGGDVGVSDAGASMLAGHATATMRTLPAPARLVDRSHDGTTRLTAPVDLGGIGKGLALRWAAARLRRRLPDGGGALLEAGGDVVASASAPGGAPWLVGVEDPRGADGPLVVVGLRDAAVATSSIAVHRWRSPTGEQVHHLIDPTTGKPGGEGLAAVTVAGTDPAWAEVRTKQLFLAGRAGIGPLARSLGLAAWWVDEGAVVGMTPAARLLTEWTPPPDGGGSR